MSNKVSTYIESGVDQKLEEKALKRLISILNVTLGYRTKIGKAITPIGHYAGIVQITNDIAIALKTDGVGTKLFISQMMDKYDTIGIDCIAMVVNDIICTGAEPLSVIDYLAVQKPDPHLIEQIGIGLQQGAKIARVNVVGGEIAQVPEMINGMRPGKNFDLVGMGIGIVNPKDVINGQNIEEGDVVIGLASSGIHSNGLTLARKIFFDQMRYNVHDYIDELDRTLGEELLEPTYIYVPEIMEMIQSGLHLKNIAHITSDGLLNLARISDKFGYVIEHLPEPQPVFKLMQRYGRISDLEMHNVCNMGIGICFTLPKDEIDFAQQIADKYNRNSFVLGYAVKDPERKIIFKPLKTVGYPNKSM